MTTHLYADDGTRDMYDLGRCVTCGLPLLNRRHRLPGRTETETEVEARKLGEGNDS